MGSYASCSTDPMCFLPCGNALHTNTPEEALLAVHCRASREHLQSNLGSHCKTQTRPKQVSKFQTDGDNAGLSVNRITIESLL